MKLSEVKPETVQAITVEVVKDFSELEFPLSHVISRLGASQEPDLTCDFDQDSFEMGIFYGVAAMLDLMKAFNRQKMKEKEEAIGVYIV